MIKPISTLTKVVMHYMQTKITIAIHITFIKSNDLCRESNLTLTNRHEWSPVFSCLGRPAAVEIHQHLSDYGYEGRV